MLPALFLSVRVLHQTSSVDGIRTLTLVASLVSLAWPIYYAGGKSTIWWCYPLPLQVLRWLLL